MNHKLQLVIRRPGSLLSKMIDIPISENQYADIVRLVSDPDRWVVAPREPIGFGNPEKARNARS